VAELLTDESISIRLDLFISKSSSKRTFSPVFSPSGPTKWFLPRERGGHVDWTAVVLRDQRQKRPGRNLGWQTSPEGVEAVAAVQS
jgi:hypothetical protein